MKTTSELSELTNVQAVYICKHWNQLYNGSARIGAIIHNQGDIEALKAKGLKIVDNIIARKRYGSEYYEPHNENLADFAEGRQRLRGHFTLNDDYFQETTESLKDIAQEALSNLLRDTDFSDLEDMKNQVSEIIDKYENLKPGFYDCNGNLIISENEINSADFAGYYEDVWSYNIIAVIEQEEREEEEEDYAD